MTKRKRVDEMRWAWVTRTGRVIIPASGTPRKNMYGFRDDSDTVIRVRVTEVVKKKRSKKR